MNIKKINTFILGTNLALLTSCGAVQKQIDKSLGKTDKNPSAPKDVNPPSGADSSLELTSVLTTFKSCADTENWLEDKVIATIEKQTQQQILQLRCQNPAFAQANQEQCKKFYQAGINRTMGAPADVATNSSAPGQAETGASSNDKKSTSSAPSSTSGTNNQVGGVEEADLVKAEGGLIYYISGKKLHIMKGWPAPEATMLGSISIDKTPMEMFVGEQNLVFLISQEGQQLTKPIFRIPVGSNSASTSSVQNTAEVDAPSAATVGSSGFNLRSMAIPSQNEQRVYLTIVDVRDPKAPQLKSQRSFRGHYHSSRKIGNDLRIVISDTLGSVILPSITFPNIDEYSQEQEDLLRDLMEVTKKRIREKDIKFWLRSEDPRGIGPQLGQCEKVYGPTYDNELGLTRILSFVGPEAMTESVLLSDVNGLFASQKSIYLTTKRHLYDQNLSSTVIHKFSWEKEGQSIYQGSGHVEGTPLNQFSMDEHNTYFRIAVTGTQPKTFESYNKVFVLAQGQGLLETKGSTPDMAKGERIYSVRFHGERGYVVTFRQVDPLFTLDLKDPAAPKIVGELKIPGFSTYIHMMNETTLLTIGRGGMGNSTSSPKISVFDVSNMAAPKETKSYIIANAGWSQSEAESNHKAFTYYDQLGVLAIPLNTENYGSPRSGAPAGTVTSTSSIMVFDVKNNPNIKLLGNIDLSQLGNGQIRSLAQRSLFMEDYLYGFSNLGMKVRKMTDLTKDVQTVSFP